MTSINITAGDDPEVPAQASPVPESSPLAALRARREKIREQLFVDVKVPRWDTDGGPTIYVRYRPLSPTVMAAAGKRRTKPNSDPDGETAILIRIDALVDACLGVYAQEEDAGPMLSLRDGDPHGSWTRFDPDLAHSLGLADAKAVDVVRGLYFGDGDIDATFLLLAEWSAQAEKKDIPERLGN